MSRPIEFRAWDKDSGMLYMQKWGSWTTTGNSSSKCFANYTGEAFTVDRKYQYREDPDVQDWDKVVWMQYTGLRDRNGVKIFEGDIVTVKKTKGVIDRELPLTGEIVYAHGAFGVKHPLDDTDHAFWLAWCEPDIEVIGNIYENPELLND